MILFTTSDDDPDYTTVRFNYDPVAVEVMKSVPVHRGDPVAKQWATESSWVELLAKRFHEKGFSVAVDGELWQPPDMTVLGSPICGLFQALPAHLRRPAYLALSRVLHPDAGGGTELMQELNKAIGK